MSLFKIIITNTFSHFYFIYLFIWLSCLWHVEVPSQRLNPCHSSNNTGSLTYCTTRELLKIIFYDLPIDKLIRSKEDLSFCLKGKNWEQPILQEDSSFFSHSFPRFQYQILQQSLRLALWRLLHLWNIREARLFCNHETEYRMARRLRGAGKSPGVLVKNADHDSIGLGWVWDSAFLTST